MDRSVRKFLFFVIGVAALGFFYASSASAAIVLHGVDGGLTPGDGKFIHSRNAQNLFQCVDTVSKTISPCGSTAPSTGYLYKGPDSAGKFYRTATCWSKTLNREVACSTSTGFISSSFSHHGVTIVGGDIAITLGDIDPSEQVMTVVPGAFGTPAKVTVDLPDVLIKGFGTKSEICGLQPLQPPGCPLGEGRFSYHVEYTVPIATSDPNRGHGNDCGKCDPNNPNQKGSSCTGCSVNQTCQVVGADAQFTVKAFCQQGVTVTGFLTWIDPNPGTAGDLPPAFTNCPADSATCTLQLGGLPLTTKGTVDDTACSQIFDFVSVGNDPNKQLAEKQLLLFQQNYQNTGCNGTVPQDLGLESPQGTKLGVHRECNSDYGALSPNQDVPGLHGEGFDNVPRGCVVATNADGSKAFHVVQGAETAKAIEVTVDLTPEAVNLKCDAGTDSGIATATICTTPEFNVTDVDTDNLPVLFVEGTCNGGLCTVPAIPGGYSVAASTSGLCSGDFNQDLRITYRTCSVNDDGLAQRIRQANGNISDGDLVPIMLHGTSGGGTVVIEGTDTVKVVKTQ